MRNYILILFTFALSQPLFSQGNNAKDVLDKTSEAFRGAGGVKAEFTIQVFNGEQSVAATKGIIQLKNNKFVLETEEAIVWFDGETQWSYLIEPDEVNISNPTEDELQSINPYALLSIYQKGFTPRLGSLKSFQSKPIDEVILTAGNKQQDISQLILYVTKNTRQPLFIRVDMRDGTRNEIVITAYRTGLAYTDSTFMFDRKKYPDAEIIDLR